MSTAIAHKMAGALGPLVFAVAPCIVACSAVADRSPNEPDCHAEDGYEFSTPLIDAEQGSPNHPTAWFGSSDNTQNCIVGVSDGVPVGNLTFVDGGAPKIDATVCTIREGTSAHLLSPGDPGYPVNDTPVYRSVVFHSEGCTFWGSNASHTQPAAPVAAQTMCQYYPAPGLEQLTGYWNGSGFEGFAFWARTPGVSNHSVYLNFNNTDTQVVTPTGTCSVPRDPESSRCTPAPSDATAGLGLAVVDYQSGTATAGGVPTRIPQPGECGNAFQHYLETTPDWRFYTIPFDTLWQLPYPNRIASGFDPSTLLQIAVVFPKEVRTELWIANIRFYRQKGSGGTSREDAGAN